MSTITTKDGTRIFYMDWGSGQPVVFSHGWPLGSDAWKDRMLLLASDRAEGSRQFLAAGSRHPATTSSRKRSVRRHRGSRPSPGSQRAKGLEAE